MCLIKGIGNHLFIVFPGFCDDKMVFEVVVFQGMGDGKLQNFFIRPEFLNPGQDNKKRECRRDTVKYGLFQFFIKRVFNFK